MRLFTLRAAAVALTNSLNRSQLGSDMGDVPRQGWITMLRYHVSAIATATQLSKITIGTRDNDRRFLCSPSSGTWDADVDDATQGALVLQFDPPIPYLITDDDLADTDNFAGMFVGNTLDAGTATADIEMVIRG